MERPREWGWDIFRYSAPIKGYEIHAPQSSVDASPQHKVRSRGANARRRRVNAGEASSALATRDIVKRYGTTIALDRISLEVARGSCVALVGESGSGKTTLLRCFNAMVRPDAGLVEVGGRAVDAFDPVELRRRIGYVQQEGGLLPHWSVLRNAALVPWLRGEPDAEERARKALERVGLPAEGFGGRWPRDLSGGQRQRVAIARALAGSPEIILLDEPFGALDAITRSELRRSFHALRIRMGVTALLVTHDLHEAVELADRIAVMKGGALMQMGRAEELMRAPAHNYVDELFERAGVG